MILQDTEVIKILYCEDRREIFYSKSDGTYALFYDKGWFNLKILNIEVISLYMKYDSDGKFHQLTFITKDGDYGYGFNENFIIRSSIVKYKALSSNLLLDVRGNLYRHVNNDWKLLATNVIKLFNICYLTADLGLYYDDGQLIEINVINFYRGNIIKKF